MRPNLDKVRVSIVDDTFNCSYELDWFAYVLWPIVRSIRNARNAFTCDRGNRAGSSACLASRLLAIASAAPSMDPSLDYGKQLLLREVD